MSDDEPETLWDSVRSAFIGWIRVIGPLVLGVAVLILLERRHSPGEDRQQRQASCTEAAMEQLRAARFPGGGPVQGVDTGPVEAQADGTYRVTGTVRENLGTTPEFRWPFVCTIAKGGDITVVIGDRESGG